MFKKIRKRSKTIDIVDFYELFKERLGRKCRYRTLGPVRRAKFAGSGGQEARKTWVCRGLAVTKTSAPGCGRKTPGIRASRMISVPSSAVKTNSTWLERPRGRAESMRPQAPAEFSLSTGAGLQGISPGWISAPWQTGTY